MSLVLRQGTGCCTTVEKFLFRVVHDQSNLQYMLRLWMLSIVAFLDALDIPLRYASISSVSAHGFYMVWGPITCTRCIDGQHDEVVHIF